jgi:hypothetical protein
MGEVYRARDAKLNRDVAIKVLPELFAADPDRLARFEREAQTLAALNHPGIAHIHGLEHAGGVRALVMELVEGEDLSTIIARGPMPLDEALPIARQIADALEAAHEQGIVHRDLKPANIKVRADGTVKVLDFGLAKAMDPAGASNVEAMNSPTFTVRGTQLGMILGTAAYMAPEQARGKAIDRRADIWAFGVVLYEMITGRQAFKGDDISEILATVLKTDPDWRALPPGVPPSIARLLRRCLEKDPRRRLSAIGDARLELDETEPATAATLSPNAARRGRAIGLPVAAALVGLAILFTFAAAWFWFARSAPGAAAVVGAPRLSIVLPDGDEVSASEIAPVAVSPDGQRIAYVARRGSKNELYMRTLNDPEPKALAGTEGAITPFFSPDGGWVGFFAHGKIKKVAVAGGAVLNVGEATLVPRGGAWGNDLDRSRARRAADRGAAARRRCPPRARAGRRHGALRAAGVPGLRAARPAVRRSVADSGPGDRQCSTDRAERVSAYGRRGRGGLRYFSGRHARVPHGRSRALRAAPRVDRFLGNSRAPAAPDP